MSDNNYIEQRLDNLEEGLLNYEAGSDEAKAILSERAMHSRYYAEQNNIYIESRKMDFEEERLKNESRKLDLEEERNKTEMAKIEMEERRSKREFWSKPIYGLIVGACALLGIKLTDKYQEEHNLDRNEYGIATKLLPK